MDHKPDKTKYFIPDSQNIPQQSENLQQQANELAHPSRAASSREFEKHELNQRAALGPPINFTNFNYQHPQNPMQRQPPKGQHISVSQEHYPFNFQGPLLNEESQQSHDPSGMHGHIPPSQHIQYQPTQYAFQSPVHHQQLPQQHLNVMTTRSGNILHNRMSSISSTKSNDSGIESSDIHINDTESSRKRHRKSDFLMPGEDGDLELKQLAFKASELPLSDLAQRVKMIENEHSPDDNKYLSQLENHKERQKQIFGMVWLLKSCESSPTAVIPRNRIYARYVQVCADNSLTPLSPASFGKLIRILFSNLTTRRLGMRGQSKYHYCGIKLVGEQFNPNLSNPHSSRASPQSSYNPPIKSPSSISRLLNLYTATDFEKKYAIPNLKYIPNLFNLVEHSLNMENMTSPLNLPSIYPYLPPDTDYDISDTLYSLYKVHCTSVFECLRYMRVKKLFSAFSNFTNILTAPVFKLYASDSVLGWIMECDLLMYTTMAKMLAKLHLQNVPDEVLQQLKLIASQYVDKLIGSLQSKVPKSFIMVKYHLAQQFISILSRLIKVIETGQSALKILSNDSEKQAMLDDWMRLDMREIVLREVHSSQRNCEALLDKIQGDFVNVFAPLSKDPEFNGSLGPAARFLSEIPGKFPNCNPRLFVLIATNLLTTFLREISFISGQSFGAWWIIKCWIDEYFNWMFELGGYLQDEFEAVNDDFSEPLPIDPENTLISQADSGNDNLRSIVDLLDGAYGLDSLRQDQDVDELLTYENMKDN
ncbi:uncharacterized protein PRCAT00000847001 [Priceomyces carsonii]|uniref:uncharacterized protein n=1 Tax=Priceomyces carsonii TaxID=28549 RepID=UPI002EDAA21D|nr:unnamed protein product [Priceomyces carsonii]